MSKQVRLRRGTTAQHATFTGAQGELTYDTDKNCLVIHDGVTPGGKPISGALILTTGMPDSVQQIDSAVRISGSANEGEGLFVDNNVTLYAGLFVAAGLSVYGGMSVDGPVSHTVSGLSYAASVALDFNVGVAASITLSGNVSFTTASRYPSRFLRLFISADGTLRNLSFPAWKWIGGAAPTSIAANKSAILELFCMGFNETDIWARYSVQP